MNKAALRRARREIEAGRVRIGGTDGFGKPHSRTRSLGRLDWRIEEADLTPLERDLSPVQTPSQPRRVDQGARPRQLAPLTFEGQTYWLAG